MKAIRTICVYKGGSRIYAEFEAHMRAFAAKNTDKPLFMQRMLCKQEANRYQSTYVVVGIPDV